MLLRWSQRIWKLNLSTNISLQKKMLFPCILIHVYTHVFADSFHIYWLCNYSF